MKDYRILKLIKIPIDKFIKKNELNVKIQVEDTDDGKFELNISNDDFLISYQPDIQSVSISNKVMKGAFFENHKLELEITKGEKVSDQLIEFIKQETK